MPDDFNGVWKLVRNENLDDFLKEIGMNMVFRKVAGTLSPTVTITQDGDKFTIKSVSSVRTEEYSWAIGEPFEQKFEGKMYKCLARWEGKKLVVAAQAIEEGGKPLTLTRENQGDEHVQTLECNGKVAKRFFKK
ncbi:unnamed protein product [Owenia fusiformis]|uniref:Lipocalin/cytosolic fatty-acid binding domain-containing protein n=1 Tax=Owenia fusiformis TaxID=6347 RepID=A0A8J1Y9S0_OWEFU|nr:unnamed protein product [Owenia fusiformis]